MILEFFVDDSVLCATERSKMPSAMPDVGYEARFVAVEGGF